MWKYHYKYQDASQMLTGDSGQQRIDLKHSPNLNFPSDSKSFQPALYFYRQLVIQYRPMKAVVCNDADFDMITPLLHQRTGTPFVTQRLQTKSHHNRQVIRVHIIKIWGAHTVMQACQIQPKLCHLKISWSDTISNEAPGGQENPWIRLTQYCTCKCVTRPNT